jgi:hypothetical protein
LFKVKYSIPKDTANKIVTIGTAFVNTVVLEILSFFAEYEKHINATEEHNIAKANNG